MPNDCIYREEQINNAIFEHDKSRIRTTVTNDETEPVSVQTVMSIPELLELAHSAGMVEGESYDEINGGRNGDDFWILEFLNEGISQFQVLMTLIYPGSFSIKKRPSQFPMLQEDGDFLLLESGDKLLVQGLIP